MTFDHDDKISLFVTFQLQRKQMLCHIFVTFGDIFKLFHIQECFKPDDLLFLRVMREWGLVGPGRARYTFSNREPKPDQACGNKNITRRRSSAAGDIPISLCNIMGLAGR